MAFEIPRARVVEAIRARLEDTPLLALTGPSGCGKTHLLEALRSEYERPAVLLQLQPLVSTPEILEHELRRLGQEILPPRRRAASAFESLLDLLQRRPAGNLLLLDDVTELRTLSYFPGVEDPLPVVLDALGRRGPTVVASRLSFWLRREIPELPRFDVPPVRVEELKNVGVGRDEASDIVRVTSGLIVHAARLAETMTRSGLGLVDALALELAPGGRMELACRAMHAELLHRARGYNACKAVLRVLSDEEPLKLTDVARRIDRTPGSTRDYLRWLEEVDLIHAESKRFSFVDPVLRLWMRIHARGTLPGEEDVRREVSAHVEGVEIAPATTPAPEPELEPEKPEMEEAPFEPYVLPRTKSDDLVEID